MTQLQKVAIKRDPMVPAGQPAPMFLDCPCGRRHSVDFPDGPDIHCPCGMAFNARGWVLKSAGAAPVVPQIEGPFKRGRFCNHIELPRGYLSIVPHAPLPMSDEEVRRLRDLLVMAPAMRDWLKEWAGDVEDTRGNCEFCGAEATCRNCRAFDLIAKSGGEEKMICWNCGGTNLKAMRQTGEKDFECQECDAAGVLEDFDPRFNKTLRNMRRRMESNK